MILKNSNLQNLFPHFSICDHLAHPPFFLNTPLNIILIQLKKKLERHHLALSFYINFAAIGHIISQLQVVMFFITDSLVIFLL